MKNFAAIFLSSLLVLSLAACGSSQPQEPSQQSQSPSSQAESSASASETDSGETEDSAPAENAPSPCFLQSIWPLWASSSS